MNEPQSVAAEMIAMTILAGNDISGNPLIKQGDLVHLALASGSAWPISPFSSLFGYKVPQGACMVWTYLSLYTTKSDESDLAINFGFNYDALAQIQVQGASGAFEPRSGTLLSQAIFNRPVFLVFGSEVTPRITLIPNSSTQATGSVRVEATAHGFLLPSGLISALRPYETRFN